MESLFSYDEPGLREGEMGALLREFDWPASLFGAVEHWPETLRTWVSYCLTARAPTALAWGPAQAVIYNDAYRFVLGSRHPLALGRAYFDIWSELGETDRETWEQVRHSGRPAWCRDERSRRGYLPIIGDSGAVEGVLVTVERVGTLRSASTADAPSAAGDGNAYRTPLEERLAETNRELRRRILEQQTLLDVLPIGIGIATDRTCREIRVNRAFATTLGLDPEANASKTGPPDERPTNFRVFTRDGLEVADDQLPMQMAARAGHETNGMELDIVHADGRIVRLLEYAAPLFDEDGSPRGAVGAFIDITERREAESALQRLYADLEEASRLKDEFLATLSHELRTPLNAVLGWAFMLREKKLSPAMEQRALDSLERNARAQARLVEDLLDVSRIVSGKLYIKADVVDLGAVVANAVDTVRATAVAKGVQLSLTIPEDETVHVTGDAGRLQQVVWNLASNGIKFTPAGGQVQLEVRRVGAEAEIVVRDTGQGIAPSFRPHLFQRFRQLDGSAGRPHGGLGLGLSIVRQLTEAHGGSVTAESGGDGLGATFRVRLPLLTTSPS